MTMTEEHNFEMPTFCRILGFGERVADAIADLQNLPYEEVSTEIATGEDVQIRDDDRLLILIFDKLTPSVKEFGRTANKSGVFTIAVSAEAISLDDNIFDAQTTVSQENMADVVRCIIDPICLQGYIHYSLEDLRIILERKHFVLKNEVVPCSEQPVADAIEKMNMKSVSLENVEALSIHLFCNRDMTPPLRIEQVAALVQFLSELPSDINCIWSVSNDDEMPIDKLRISMVLAGKNL